MIEHSAASRSVDILMVEDNPADVELAIEALHGAQIQSNIHIVEDGVRALEYLRRNGEYRDATRPSLILLDLNLPRKDGREVLAELKNDDDLKSIPVVVLTTSDADEDVRKSYDLHCNCYVTKPYDFEDFVGVVKAIESFWLSVVKLPAKGHTAA